MNHKSYIKNNSDFEHFGILSTCNIKRNKFPLIITVAFFLVFSLSNLVGVHAYYDGEFLN